MWIANRIGHVLPIKNQLEHHYRWLESVVFELTLLYFEVANFAERVNEIVKCNKVKMDRYTKMEHNASGGSRFSTPESNHSN